MKIIVGYPPIETKIKGNTPLLSQNRQYQEFHNETYLFPVVLGTAATWLKEEGNNVIWLDAIAERISYYNFVLMLEKENPSLFFFETKCPVIKQHWKIINDLKQRFPNMKIAICGDHVSFLPKETMENSDVDFVITSGYYDFAIVELVDALKNNKDIPEGIWHRKEGKIIENGIYKINKMLDSAPIIDRILTKNELYQKEYNIKERPYAYIMSARDCYYGKCKFCVWNHTLYPKGSFRFRSPENVMEEVKYLVDKIGIKEIFDDAGTITIGEWLKKFCKLMIESGYNKKVIYSCNMRFGAVGPEEYKLMKEAGFRLLKFGLESANQKTLDRIDKGIKVEDIEEGCKLAKQAKLEVHLTMMIGYNWETKEDALNTLKLAKKLMLKGYADVLQSTVVVPYPGTPLYEEAIKENMLLVEKDDYESFDMTRPILKTPDMTPEEVMTICNSIYSKIFLSPKYVIRHLSKIKSIDDIKYTLKGLKAVLGHIKDFKK